MARSYKRVPGFRDNDCCKKPMKRQAARKVRHADNVENGSDYKKLYNKWDICEHNCRIHNMEELKEGIKNGWTSPIYKWFMK